MSFRGSKWPHYLFTPCDIVSGEWGGRTRAQTEAVESEPSVTLVPRDAPPAGLVRNGQRRLGVLGHAELTLLDGCCGCPPSDHKADHASAVPVGARRPGTCYNLQQKLRLNME